MLVVPDKVYPLREVSQGKNLTGTFAEEFPLTILIAEDNFVNQKLIERILSKLGYLTDTASDGVQALEFLNEKEYNVILMDVRMPEMDGHEVTQAIRRMPIKQPYIIAMTANVMSSDRDECFQVGMNDFIPKPIIMEEVIAKLKIASAFCSFGK